MKKTPVLTRRYHIRWVEPVCGFKRGLTLSAKNKKDATRLVADRYPARSKHQVKCLK